MDEAREDLGGYIARYEQPHFRAWGIEHRADKKLIGITNFGFISSEDRRAEMGYAISARHTGGKDSPPKRLRR